MILIDQSKLDAILDGKDGRARRSFDALTAAGMPQEELIRLILSVLAAGRLADVQIEREKLLGIAPGRVRARRDTPSLSEKLRTLATDVARVVQSPVFGTATVMRRYPSVSSALATLIGDPDPGPVFVEHEASLDSDLPDRMKRFADELEAVEKANRKQYGQRNFDWTVQQEVLLLDAVEKATGSRHPTGVVSLLSAFVGPTGMRNPYNAGGHSVRALVGRYKRFKRKGRKPQALLIRTGDEAIGFATDELIRSLAFRPPPRNP